jgi:lipopolysaccharide export system permease protein
MRTVRRLLYVDIVSAVAFVAAAFLSLFFFIDFVDELGSVGTRGYSALNAAAYSLLLVPAHFYELVPIAVLIGGIYALARLAQTSQFAILRTGGLGPWRALWLLTSLGLMFALLTYIVGDYVAPQSERLASDLQILRKGAVRLGSSGAWLKDHASTPEGERSYFVNIGSTESGALLHDIRIFEFDAEGRLQRRIAASTAKVANDSSWQLADVDITRWLEGSASRSTAQEQKLTDYRWPSTLSGAVVAAAVLPVSTMSTTDLYRYIGHLSSNEQAAQRQQIQFWKRAFYPFACLVMIGLSLPFAYLSARSGGISLKVFGGIMLGISFVLLNNVAGHLGLLRNWTPWIVAAAPSALYMLLSFAAFSWLVRYR